MLSPRIQYQVKTEPVTVPVSASTTVANWFIPFSEPTRNKPYSVALQPFNAYDETAQFPETTLLPKWYSPLSDPVRIKLWLGSGLQQFYTANIFPIPNPPPPLTSLQSWEPWSEPLHSKPGLLTGIQQFWAGPVRYLPQPIVFVTLAAIETQDTGDGAINVTSGAIVPTNLSGIRVSVIEVAADRGAVTSIIEQ